MDGKSLFNDTIMFSHFPHLFIPDKTVKCHRFSKVRIIITLNPLMLHVIWSVFVKLLMCENACFFLSLFQIIHYMLTL